MQIYMYVIIAAVSLFGAVATIVIANSKENKDGNPSYDKKAGKNWIRLTVVYVISALAGLGMLLLFLSK